MKTMPSMRVEPTVEPSHRTVTHASWVVPAVSALTMAWVVAQLFAGVTMRTGTWPIAGFPMFRDTPTAHVDHDLVATTESGRRVPMKASDFGLQRLQLNRYLGEHVVRGGELRMMADEAMGRVISLWNATHGDDPAVEVRLIEVRTLFPAGSGTTSETLAEWEAS